MNLYVVADKVSGKYFECFFANTDGEAIRNNLPALCRIRRKDDIQIIRVAQIYEDIVDNQNFQIGIIENENVPFDTYHFDEITAESMSKTDAQKQIELWKKSRELQLESLQKQLNEERSKINEQ